MDLDYAVLTLGMWSERQMHITLI